MEFKYNGTTNSIYNLSRQLDNYTKKNILKDTNVTSMGSVYLRLIWENPGITQLKLSQENSTSKATVVTYITNLEKKGMVRKKEANGKKKLYCTSQGKQVIEEIMKNRDELIQYIFQGYTEEELRKFFYTADTVAKRVTSLEKKLMADKEQF